MRGGEMNSNSRYTNKWIVTYGETG